MNLYNFSLLCFAFCSFFVGMLVFLKRQDNIGISYFLANSLFSVWGVGISILFNPEASVTFALFATRLANLAAMFGIVVFLHFTVLFCDVFQKRKNLIVFFYILAGIIGCFSFTPLYIPNIDSALNFVRYGRAGIVYHIYAAMFAVVVPLCFVQLGNKIRKSGGDEKRQTIGLFLASLMGFAGGSGTFFPIYGINLPQYGLFLMPIYPFVMAYFLMRGNLFDLTNVAEAAHRDKLASIGVLATSINHEVKNPLFIISGLAEGYLSKVKEGLLSDPAERLKRMEEILTKTIEQSYRASEIIKRFAMFAKEGVKEEMMPEPLALGQVLDDVLPLVRHELEIEKIELVRDIPSDLPMVTADRHHLTQIFFNLIVNACQAMSSGGKLAIKATRAGDSIQITIEDTGSGMSEEQLREIFQPFRTTKAEGTGLGLYITKLLVEKNGGRISVESKVGKGTKFVLEFRGNGKGIDSRS